MTVERLLFKLVDEVKNSHNTSYSLDKVADDVMKEFDELMQDRVLEEQAMRETEEDMRVPF
jgi:predicted transcriptional regulator